MAERYENDLVELEKQIPEVQELTQRPFHKEQDLLRMKAQLEKLETEISQRIAQKEKEAAGPEIFIAGETQTAEVSASEELSR
jgi:hypothetical protein